MNQTCYIVISNYRQSLHSSLTRAKRECAAIRSALIREGFGRNAPFLTPHVEARTVRDMAVHAHIPSTKGWSITL